jgi:hypothetical protein
MEAEEVYKGIIIRRENFGGAIFGALWDLQRGVEFGSGKV